MRRFIIAVGVLLATTSSVFAENYTVPGHNEFNANPDCFYPHNVFEVVDSLPVPVAQSTDYEGPTPIDMGYYTIYEYHHDAYTHTCHYEYVESVFIYVQYSVNGSDWYTSRSIQCTLEQ